MSSSSESETHERREVFQDFYRENLSQPATIFDLKALHFSQFTSDRIVFRFKPSELISNISPADRFLCVLTYDGKHWRIRRDTFPVNYKWRIYNVFWSKLYFKITDELLSDAIFLIYEFLYEWTKHFEQITKERFQRFRDGDSDVDLFEDEEALIFTEEEIEDRRRRKEEIWQRMLPPPAKPVELEQRRLRRRRVSSTSS